MPTSRTYDVDGTLVSTTTWDATTYTVTNASGAVTEQRPVTEMEAEQHAAEVAEANAETLRQQVRAAIDSVQASRDTLRLVTAKTNAQISGADTKSVAREVIRTQKVLIAVLRLVGESLASADTGAD